MHTAKPLQVECHIDNNILFYEENIPVVSIMANKKNTKLKFNGDNEYL